MPLTPITLPGGSGIPAVGTILSISNLGSPPVFIPLGNVGNIKWDMKTKSADTTNQGTVWEQSIPTLLSAGTVTFDIHFIPGSPGRDGLSSIVPEGHSFSSGLGYIFINQQIRTYTFRFPDGTLEVFTGYIEDFPIEAHVDKDLLSNIKLKVTGQPVFI